MNRQEASEALALLRQVVNRARDDTTLQNWGVIWMVHALTNGGGFVATNFLMWRGHTEPWPYLALWSAIVPVNILTIFLLKSGTAGARTFIETQIWVIWMSFIAGVALTALVNHISGFQVFTLGPIIAVLSAFAFSMMGGIMGRRWFWPAAAFGGSSLAMALMPDWQFILLGSLWGGFQFVAGFLMHRAKRRRLTGAVAREPRLV
jgi:hypothetical protein